MPFPVLPRLLLLPRQKCPKLRDSSAVRRLDGMIRDASNLLVQNGKHAPTSIAFTQSVVVLRKKIM